MPTTADTRGLYSSEDLIPSEIDYSMDWPVIESGTDEAAP